MIISFPLILSNLLNKLAARSNVAATYRKIDRIGWIPIINNFTLYVVDETIVGYAKTGNTLTLFKRITDFFKSFTNEVR